MDTTQPSLRETIFESFEIIVDQRAGNASHPLGTILFTLVVAVICGADGFVQAEQIANMKKAFIKKYVPLRRGIPSHDTMARVLGALDTEQFVQAFATFMERLTGRPKEDILNLDGKTLRGVVGAARTKTAHAEDQTHMVSIFSAFRRLVLGSLRSMSAANEVKAGQDLLQIVDIQGATVTIDAAHTVHETLKIIEERGADVVVAVKANAGALHAAMEEAFKTAVPKTVETFERLHGTDEHRVYGVIPATVVKGFETLKSFVYVLRQDVSHSALQQRHERETFYATSLPPSRIARIAECIRARWSIENGLHHVLDVAFSEDRSRIRKEKAPEHFSRLRHIAFCLLSLVKTPRLSFALKRMKALADDRFLARVLRLPVR